jgi:hypothetical protein
MVERLVENERVQREAIIERLVECDSKRETQKLFLCVSQSTVLRVVTTIRFTATISSATWIACRVRAPLTEGTIRTRQIALRTHRRSEVE